MARRAPRAVLTAPGESPVLALLHTSPVHVSVLDALRDQSHPGLELLHSVAEDLLERAPADGPATVAGDVRARVREAAGKGARALLCTWSTIGGVAEAAGADSGVAVLRVDRPMAAAAAAGGPRVVVLAALESTLAPTLDLIGEEAHRAGRSVEVRTVLIPGSWERFAAGDAAGYAHRVARVARVADAVTGADAIILAQASMAPAKALVTTSVPVLSSPRPGLAAAARPH